MVDYSTGTIDLEALEISDIIDIKILQEFLDNITIVMECAAMAVDRSGREVTRPSRHRDYIDSLNVSSLINQASRSGKPHVGEDHTGMVEFAVPVIVEGRHIGTVLGGLPLQEDTDHNADALARIVFIVVNSMAESGYNKLETEYFSSALAENFLQISSTIEMLAESAQTITDSQQKLGGEIEGINDLTREIGSILEAIAKVADKTKLIGLNASIEAARLGNDGRGFAVVANSIQELSENTKMTTKQVTELNKQIDEKISATLQNSSHTLEITEDQSAAMEQLTATIQSSVKLAEQLKDHCSKK